jgi:geranylgeranyl diphosphate synthase type II
VTHAAGSLDTWLAAKRALVDRTLESLPDGGGVPGALRDAKRESRLAGGQRLRPLLVLAGAYGCGARVGLREDDADALAMPAAAAIELIHTYSLIHDDLPSMDNDTMRRGRPTSHVVHGEAMAILAGDALLTEAFTLLARETPGVGGVEPQALVQRRIRVIDVVAAAAGPRGMVGGQVLDLQAVRPGAAPLDREGLRAMHTAKTGALIRGSVIVGAVMAGADRNMMAAVDAYGEAIGLAFQIVDDILDVEAPSADLGKTAGKDAEAGKPTYPAIYGLAESRRLADDCIRRALDSLENAALGGQLPGIARWVVSRTH